jgi:hypothetical protein
MKADILEFYEKVMWLPGMPKKESLTDNELNQIKDTMMFAKWMLRNKFSKCVQAIKDKLNKHK